MQPLLLQCERFRVVRAKQVNESGEERTREIIQHPGAVVLLPMVDDDHVCLIHNYRVSVGRTLLEVPAGTLEVGEDLEVAARRELIEETGYAPGKLEKLGAFYPSPGIMDERMHLYLATDLVAGKSAREAGEWIENHVVSWSEAMQLIKDSQIEDAKTIVALLLYDKLRR
ncbi:MAG: ADP-ribose pyrophosphatase [Pirellulaceae bacterium]|jgi:ADP-ribose pyrophosphatase